uniref:Variant surface glycoprotein 1125.197 n=1 Tax=Trypanosoma brucei TaxID=5691 RepID=A0A1J0R5D8_9TRYP|nr:variant surface glycoprotein 1125.197 [Trypanosoma brucei]
MYARSLTLFLAAVTATAHAGNIAASENQGVHAALCAFVTMLGRNVEVTTIEPLHTAAYELIQELNFTLSSPTWQQKFYTNAEREEVHADASKAGVKTMGGDKYWEHWKKAAESFKKGTDNKRVKEVFDGDVSETAKQLGQAEIAVLAEELNSLQQHYKTPSQAAQDLTAEKAKQIIAEAVTGEPNGKLNSITADKVFGGSISSTARAAACTVKDATPSPVTVLAALACVCQSDNADTITDGACGNQAATAAAWNSDGGAVAASVYQTLGRTCGGHTAGPVTVQEIKQAVKHVRQLINSGASDGQLGAFRSDCTGRSNAGMCIKFTNLATAGETAIKPMKWLAELEDLAEAMEAKAAAAAAVSRLNLQLKTKETAAQVAIKKSKTFAATFPAPAPVAQPTPKTDLKNKCEAHNKSKTACLGAKCAWKGQKEDDGQCTPTEAQVAEQEKQKDGAEGADGTAGTTEKCKGKLEPEYTEAPECKWENNACKDSSILVNKKFALSLVSAAFMVLLF